MTIAFRGVESTGTGSAADNITVSVPSAVQNGDCMLLCCVNSDSSDPADFNNPSGWQTPRLVNNLQTGGSAPSAPGMSVWWRIASSEPSSYNITTNPTAANGLIAFIIAFSGVDNSNPIDQTTTTATGDSTNADPPSITTQTDDALTVIASWHDSTTAVGNTPPTNYTDSGEGRVTGNGGGNGTTAEISYRTSTIGTPGAENPGTYTTTTEQWGAFTIALREVQTTYKLEGVTKDNTGTPKATCECFLFKDNGDNTLSFIAHDQSDGSGNYSFTGLTDNDSAYLVYSFKDDTPHVFDVTDHVLQPVLES